MPATGSDRRLRVLFMGTPELAVPTLDRLLERHHVVAVATQPDRRAGRGKTLQPSPVKARARIAGVPVLQPPDLRDPRAVEAIAAAEPEAIVVVAYGLILPPSVLAIPPLGCINVHASLLPRHRGASPIQAAILAGDEGTGVTTMAMDEGLDTGPILMRRAIEIRADETAGTLADRLAAIGAQLLIETLDGLATGTVAPRPQPAEGATLTRLIRKADGRIDWRRPAVEIERAVRALQPWPSAWTSLEDTRLQIWKAEPLAPGEHGDREAAPGTVLAADGGLVVACGDRSALRIAELQRAGSRRLSAADFLRGVTVEAGARLGDGEPPEADSGG